MNRPEHKPWFVHPDISEASTIAKAFYLSNDAFEQAKEKIFARTWQWLCNNATPLHHGQCVPVTLLPGYLNEPLLLTQKNDSLLCLSNVCTHRGAQLISAPCTLPHIRCPYHGRLFHLDGSFRSMPEFKEVKNFPTKADDLTSLPIQKMPGSLFTNLSGEEASFHQYFGPMVERLSWLPIHEFIMDERQTQHYEINAHWALYCENYLEGFHIPFVHPALNAALEFNSYTTELYSHGSLQLGIAKEHEDCFELPVNSPDYGKKVAAYYYFIFPNLMFNFYPWGLSLNVVQPISIQQTRVSFYSFVWKQEKLQTGAGADLNTTELEDEAIVESVQRGIASRFYRQGRYSVKHEKGTHHFHRLLAQFMNA